MTTNDISFINWLNKKLQLRTNFSDTEEWNTTKINTRVANYEVLGNRKIGLSFGRHKPECIERNGDFWHSKEKTGDRGVQVTFNEKVFIRSFEFQTRQDSVEF